MKILRLDLTAFGPFTGCSLPLHVGNHGIHILFGQNEAGKSSSLRAIEQLLFGIPERMTDAFMHPYDKLRIGARLRHSDGSELEFIRRKARKHPLLAADDKTPLDASQLTKYLGRIDQGLFTSMFGLNRDTLERGGQEILRGGGQLGQLLFAAGSGIADLRRVQEKLQNELEDLFRRARPEAKDQRPVGGLAIRPRSDTEPANSPPTFGCGTTRTFARRKKGDRSCSSRAISLSR